MRRLSRATLTDVPRLVRRPDYDPADVQAGIVHLGIGAFQRAHMAAYLQPLLSRDLSWGVIGASLRAQDTSDALGPQDGLYTLVETDGAGERMEIMGALCGVLGPHQRTSLLDRLAATDTRIVSLTVTEKGYLRGADGGLDMAHPAVRADLSGDRLPTTVPGLLAMALRRRQAAGIPPFTVLSCDNLPSNGHVIARVLTDFARATDPGFATWIEDHVSFPSTMVDRIVPATTDAGRRRVGDALGLDDAWPVIAEPFSQWVIEDRFTAGRPAWEDSGATLVGDAGPWEETKLRLLNGSHSAIAYLGLLIGCETVAAAMRVPAIAHHVVAMMDESATTLRMASDPDLPGYRERLLQRFRNPALRHSLTQIATDGSQKIPQRLLLPGAIRASEGRSVDRIALGIAAWLRVASGLDDRGGALPLDDPEAARLRVIAVRTRAPAEIVATLFASDDLVAEEMRVPALRRAVTRMLEALARDGAMATLHKLDAAGA